MTDDAMRKAFEKWGEMNHYSPGYDGYTAAKAAWNGCTTALLEKLRSEGVIRKVSGVLFKYPDNQYSMGKARAVIEALEKELV